MMKKLTKFMGGAALGLATLLGSVLLQSTASAVTIANSLTEWSPTGEQGFNSWFNGWRNFSADGGLASLQATGVITYDPGTHFIPFLNDGTNTISPTNQWTGSQWELSSTKGPWTVMGSNDAHPNGTNSAPNQEHWIIRRWVADIAAPQQLELRSNLTMANTGGTTAHLFLNGALVDTVHGAGNGNAIVHSVYHTINPGDILDFALTPQNGPDVNARSDGSDGSRFSLIVTDEQPPVPPIPPVADSADDWSTNGTQGHKNWFNGYYNKTTDGDATYSVNDFTPFLSDGTTTPSATNHWNGTIYDLNPAASGPWTEMGAQNVHPNGTNSAPNQEQWVVRRYVANDLTGTTPLALDWQARKTNLNGAGVTGKLFVNGVEVASQAIAGNNGAGVNNRYYINANPGDVIDLALTPVGPNGDATDGSDGSATRLTIRDNLPTGPLYNTTGQVIANSVLEFSGNQGQDSWFYGYYDVRSDATAGDSQYSVGEFVPFRTDGTTTVTPQGGDWKNATNDWSGSKYDLMANSSTGPWTEITNTGGHPAANAQGDPEVHWAMRRWVSEESSPVRIAGTLTKGAAGDGTVGRILLDGVEVWSQTTTGNVINFAVDLQIAEGQVLDFAIDPDGANRFDETNGPGTIGLVNDGSDSTTFSFTIEKLVAFHPVPEPASGLLLLGSMFGLLAARRRRA